MLKWSNKSFNVCFADLMHVIQELASWAYDATTGIRSAPSLLFFPADLLAALFLRAGSPHLQQDCNIASPRLVTLHLLLVQW